MDKRFGSGLLVGLMCLVMAAVTAKDSLQQLKIYNSDRTSITTLTQDGTNLDIDTGVDVTGTVTATAGAITGNLVVDTSTLYVNASTNRVGVGTSSPSALLDVSASDATAVVTGETDNAAIAINSGADAGGEYSTLYFRSAGNNKWALQKTNSDHLTLYDYTGGRATFSAYADGIFSIFPNGGDNFGIGTSIPDQILTVVDSDESSPVFAKIVNSAGSDGAGTGLILSTSVDVTAESVGSIIIADRTNADAGGDTDLIIRNSAGTTMTERMRIKANGNIIADTSTFVVDAVNNRVGFGDATPDATVDVAGNAIIEDEITIGDFIALSPVTAPATPASGARIYMDSVTGNICAIDSTGTTTTLGTF